MNDAQVIRNALRGTHFSESTQEGIIWNDKRKDGTRRLKLWHAREIFDAPRQQQEILEWQLKRDFDGRYVTGYFVRGTQFGCWGLNEHPSRSLCIVLKI